jgi:hypothetical protein
MHLCEPNALASVLYVLGFDGEAEEIHGYGVANMQNHPVVDALHQIHEKARMVLPNWIQISKYKCTKQKGAVGLENVEQGTILLAVLASSDDHKAHAVAIHDGFIYDANEAVALHIINKLWIIARQLQPRSLSLSTSVVDCCFGTLVRSRPTR